MDKIDRILDLIENHAGYSPGEIEDILADSEMRELYERLSGISGALHAGQAPADDEVEEEWRRFERRHFGSRRQTLWRQRRAAMITAVVVTSLAAVGMGVGIGVSISNRRDAAASVSEMKARPSEQTLAEAAHDSEAETVSREASDIPATVEFENETLEAILGRIAGAEGLDVRFVSEKPKELRLFFVWDTAQPLEETIDRLDNFESFDISLNGRTITVK